MIIRRINNWPHWGRKSPFEELEQMRRQMDRLFEGLSGNYFREPKAGVFPLTNVTEDKESFYIRSELPGIDGEDLDISVTGSDVNIAGERKIPPEDEQVKYHRRERESGKFSRMITLPAQIDVEKVEASCNDGILTMVLPKSEAARPKQINIK